MNQALKQRLVGAVVLLALGVIFLPGLLRESQQAPVNRQSLVPEAPDYQRLAFENPDSPENIEPAPDPQTMFLPPSEQPPQDALEQVDIASPEEESASDAAEPGASQPEEPASADEPEGESAEQMPDAWVVQVASFRSQQRALELRDQLQDQGYRAYKRSATTDSGQVNRVFIGPKIDKETANEVKRELDEALGLNTLVVRFEP